MYKIINTIILIALIIAVSFLSYSFYRFQFQQSSLPDLPASTQISQTQAEQVSSYITQDQLNEEISSLKKFLNQSLATISATPTQTTTIITSTSPQTSFINMGDTYSTTSQAWTNVPGSEVYIDMANDYSEDAYITWSASLKVAHGNGQAFARLYDDTNKIAVAGSEFSTSNNDTYTQKTSGQLAFWRGNNLYKVQIKSLNSFEVSYTSGKIKINY